MREKMQRFMSGRYGVDELSKFLNIFVLVFLVISMFAGWLPLLSIFYWIGIALMPGLQTDGPRAEGTRQDMYYLPEVQERICAQKLTGNSGGWRRTRYVRLYQYQPEDYDG